MVFGTSVVGVVSSQIHPPSVVAGAFIVGFGVVGLLTGCVVVVISSAGPVVEMESGASFAIRVNVCIASIIL